MCRKLYAKLKSDGGNIIYLEINEYEHCDVFLDTALGGINIKGLLDDAALEEGGKQLLDFNDTMGDRIQVFIE